jgi:hypothetical protein
MNYRHTGQANALAQMTLVVLTATSLACDNCELSYSILEDNVIESDITLDVVSEGFSISEWNLKIDGHVEGITKDFLSIRLYGNGCELGHFKLDLRMRSDGLVEKIVDFHFLTETDGCPRTYSGASWDQLLLSGTMEYTHDEEYVTFNFTDFTITADGIESTSPPYFSTVTIDGTYRAELVTIPCP